MTREEALANLTADTAHDRLKAARFLARYSKASDIQLLRNALLAETVSYVRTSLNLAIDKVERERSKEAGRDSVEEFHISPDLRAHIKNEVTKEVTGLILHEVASPVGLVAASAAREIPDYESSKTKIHLDNLRNVFDGIEQLKGASAVPKPIEFDLAELLSEVINLEVGERQLDISLHGRKPFLITNDRALVKLAVSNGVRNAVDSVESIDSIDSYPIIVTWGETDVDYWVAVLDRGTGIAGPVESAFGVGKTTKQGHSGFGLAIARQAAETLGGTCTLQPAAEGGAHFEIRWER